MIKSYRVYFLISIVTLVFFFTAITVISFAQALEIDAAPGTAADDAIPDVIIDVYGEGLLKTKLAVPPLVPAGGVKDGGSMGGEAAMIVGKDLQFSSYYEIVASPSFSSAPAGGFTEMTIDFKSFASAEHLIAGTYSLGTDGQYTFDLRLFDVTQKAMLTKAVYKGGKEMFRRLMHRFADEVLRAETGAPGPFESKIVFVGDSGGHREIFMCDSDGHNMMKITNNETINLSPSWSPDAKKLVYTSYVLNNPDIFTLPITGGKPLMLFGGNGLSYGATWGRKSNRIAFASSNNKNSNQEIYTMKPDGTDVRQVTFDPWSIDVSPSWSPDGNHIAFVSNRQGDKPQIFITPQTGGTAMRVSRTGGYNTEPSWGSGILGNYILFCGRAGGGLDLLAVRLDDSLKTLETIAVVNGRGADEAPSISPDGRYVVYIHGFGNNYDLYMTSLREQKPRRLTNLPGKEAGPEWSPSLRDK